MSAIVKIYKLKLHFQNISRIALTVGSFPESFRRLLDSVVLFCSNASFNDRLRQNFYFFSQFQRVHNVRRRSWSSCFVSRSSTLTASCTNSGSVPIRFTQLLQIFKFEVILPVFLSSNGWRNWRTTVRPFDSRIIRPLIFNPIRFRFHRLQSFKLFRNFCSRCEVNDWNVYHFIRWRHCVYS